VKSPEPLYKGIIGPYGKIKGAPGFIAFIGNMDGPNVQEHTGYTGEGIILEAEALHVATCWVGGFYRKEVVASLIDMKQNEEVLGITPIGYVVKRQATTERLITGFGLTHRRKSLSTIVTGLKEVDWPVWIKAALDAARLAPSAVNRQPWKFNVEPDNIIITVNKPGMEFNISRRLDCGIAMLHIEISALSHGIHGSWEFLEAPRVARFRAGNLVVTV